MSPHKILVAILLLAASSVQAKQGNGASGKGLSRLEEVQAKAIAEYRVPLPGSEPFKIQDGRWYRTLTNEQKKMLFTGSDGPVAMGLEQSTVPNIGAD
jgi:hypothetical protein